MANRVDIATLVVRDLSSKPIAKINAELRKLYATAKSLKNIRVDFKVTGNVAKASADIRKLTADLRQLQGAARAIRLTVSGTGIQQAQRQINQLRASARAPIVIATRAAGAPPRQPPPPTARGGVFAQGAAHVPGRFSVYVLGGIIGLTAGSMAGIASAIGRATREGVKNVDIGDTALTTLQLDRIAKETAEFNKTAPKERQIPPSDVTKTAIDEIERIRKAQQTTPGGALMNRGLISQTIAETLPLAGYDVKQAGWLAEQQISFIKMEVQRGRDLAHAQETAVKYIKGLDLSGVLKDETGKFNKEKAELYINALKQIAPSLGREFTGENVFQFLKYARQARYTATPETLMYGMLTSEEMGASSAGVAINQAVRQLLGLNVPGSTLDQLAKAGLVTTKQVEEGAVGGKKKTKRVVDQPVDEEGLRANFWRFIGSTVIPKLEKTEITDPKTGIKRFLKPSDPQDAAMYAARITSTQTARDLVTGAITRFEDLRQEVERAKMRDPKFAIDPKSMLIGVEGLTSQIRGVLGEAVNVLEPILIPGMQKVGNYMSDLGRDMRAATEGDKKAQVRVEGTAAKMLAATGGAGLLMAGPIGQAIAGMGVTAGLAGAVAPGASQTAQSLSLAGVSLNTAGQQLQAAAKMQGLAAVAGATALGAAGAGGAAAGGTAARLGRLGLGALKVGGYAGLLVSLFGPEIASLLSPSTDTEAARKNQLPTLEKEAARQAAELETAKTNLAEAQRAAQSKAVGGRTIPQTVLADIEQQKTRVEALTSALKAANDEYERMQVEGALPKGMSGDPFWKSFWESVQRDKPAAVPPDVKSAIQQFVEQATQGVTPVPAGFPKDVTQKKFDAIVKKAKDAAAAAQKKADAEHRKQFPKGVPLPPERPKEAPPRAEEPEKKVEATATTFAQALDRLRTEEPAWLSTYKTVTTDEPAWVEPLRAASIQAGTVGAQYAALATTLSDASTTNADSARKIIEANATWVSTAAQVANAQTTAATSMQSTVAQLIAAPSAFATAFSAGATEIGNSGSTAANIITGAMPNAGALLGNAAAAAIQAAVSNINITANVDVKRPDAGAANP